MTIETDNEKDWVIDKKWDNDNRIGQRPLKGTMTIEWDNDNCLGQTAKVVFQIPIALGQGKQFGTMVILVQGLQNGALTIEYFIDNRMGQ